MNFFTVPDLPHTPAFDSIGLVIFLLAMTAIFASALVTRHDPLRDTAARFWSWVLVLAALLLAVWFAWFVVRIFILAPR